MTGSYESKGSSAEKNNTQSLFAEQSIHSETV